MMGLLHCPLCMGLAVLSAVRFMAHVVLALQLEMQRTQRTSHPADLLGTIFGL
ncbi:putative conserved secreted protein [Synechococcus sp. A15-60]|nr:putative conserved secreted protein [Synechococcus sp. A15-60]